MMTFRTVLNQEEIQKSKNQINYQSKIGLMGSCFVENIGERLAYFKFDSFVNPHGILFNPKAIEKALFDIVSRKKYTKEDLEFKNGLWLSLHHHSSFSNKEVIQTLQKINQRIEQALIELKMASHLIITLGTAWVYHHIETNQLVANCHKIARSNFKKRLLSTHEIIESLTKSIEFVKSINPKIQFIFTLSPVRHLKDGMLSNSVSKALLLSGIHEVISHSSATYFPSYELLLDDLRDYRFYTKDMLHPNETAIDYIWKVFKEIWIAPVSYTTMEEIASIQKDVEHRPFNPDSEAFKKFTINLQKKKEKLFETKGIRF